MSIEVIQIAPAQVPTVISVFGGSSGGGGPSTPLPPFVYIQPTPSAVWGPIAHLFGFRPASVTVFSLDYTQQYEEFNIQHFDENTLRLGMETPTTGVALIR